MQVSVRATTSLLLCLSASPAAASITCNGVVYPDAVPQVQYQTTYMKIAASGVAEKLPMSVPGVGDYVPGGVGWITGPHATCTELKANRPAIGVNDNMGLNYYSQSDAFIDAFKTFSGWTQNNYGTTPYTPTFTPSGELVPFPAGRSLYANGFTNSRDAAGATHYPVGTYTVAWDKGDGDFSSVFGSPDGVKLHAWDSLYSYLKKPGKFSLDVTAGSGSGVQFYMTRDNPAAPVTGMHVYVPGYTAADAGRIFTDQFVASLGGFSVVRFMDDLRTNNNGITQATTWDRRPHLSDAQYTSINGAPLELPMTLVARQGGDPWINIPFDASDDYIAQEAALVHSMLPAGHRVWVEYSNEVWNWSFKAAQEQQTMYPPGNKDNFYGQTSWYSYRSEQIFRIFEKVFGKDSYRLVRVIAGQASWADRNNFLLTEAEKFAGGNVAADVLAIAPYVPQPAVPQDAAGNPTVTTAAYLALIDKNIDTTVKGWLAANNTIALNHKVALVAYEAGAFAMPVNGNKALTAFLLAADSDPGMYDVYTHYLDVWFQSGGKTINFYEAQGNGQWGLKRYYDSTLDESPKLRAVTDYMKKLGQAK